MTNFKIIVKKETVSKFGKNRTFWLTMKLKAASADSEEGEVTAQKSPERPD